MTMRAQDTVLEQFLTLYPPMNTMGADSMAGVRQLARVTRIGIVVTRRILEQEVMYGCSTKSEDSIKTRDAQIPRWPQSYDAFQ